MKRWLVFDSTTADAAHQAERDIEVRNDGSVADALDAAVRAHRTVVLVVPAGDDQATVARITPPEPQRS